MSNILFMFFSIVLTENYSLTKFFSFLNIKEEEKTTKSLVIFCATLSIILTLSAALMWPILKILVFLKLEYLYIIFTVVIIILITEIVKKVLSSYFKAFFAYVENTMPIVMMNSTVLGSILISMDSSNTFLQTLVSGFAAGVGYTLAVMIFQGINNRIKEANIPEIFKGSPILIVAAFIAAIAFNGFSGIIGNIFS